MRKAGMTLQELDEVLRIWKTRLSSIAENLMELQADAAYQSLAGTGGITPVTVTGATAGRLKPALGAMHTIFEQFGLLQSTVDKAEKLRGELPAFFGGDAKAREIQQLLFGRSIQLAVIDVPLEQRTLLGGIRSAERVTPEELLEPMNRSFAAARDAVTAVDRAWIEFAERSGRIEAEIARLREQRALPSALLVATLADVEGHLETVREHVQTDPLGAQGELQTQVEPALAQVARRVELAMQLGSQLRAACVRRDEVVRVHAEAAIVAGEAHDKVADALSLPPLVAENKIRGVGEWLTRLERKRDEGVLEAVAIGLRHWNAAAEACVLQDRKAQDAARARIEQRSELRGRMDALKAKARRYGIAESHETTELSGKAEALLYSQPTDLTGSAAAVAEYEKHLRGNGREA